MITLETLPQATAQEVFNQVSAHLLKQDKKCVGDYNTCVYKNLKDNTACAAGCLIADSEYRTDFERKAWFTLVDRCMVPHAHWKLIESLQLVHDECPEHDWENELKNIAEKNKFEL